MCGIAGYVGTRRLEEAAVVRCVDALRQRGPDDSGVRRFAMSAEREVCLVNRCLRIIDLDERARQRCEYDGRCITYSGELYNYVELRHELAARGAQFRTQSDTEVLAAVI